MKVLSICDCKVTKKNRLVKNLDINYCTILLNFFYSEILNNIRKALSQAKIQKQRQEKAMQIVDKSRAHYFLRPDLFLVAYVSAK